MDKFTWFLTNQNREPDRESYLNRLSLSVWIKKEMNLITLTTVLSLISVASCAESSGTETVAVNSSENVVANSGGNSNLYTKKVIENEGKKKILSRLRIAPNTIRADKAVDFRNEGLHMKSYSSDFGYNPAGIDLSSRSVGKIAKNLDPKFVKSAVMKELKKREQEKSKKENWNWKILWNNRKKI